MSSELIHYVAAEGFLTSIGSEHHLHEQVCQIGHAVLLTHAYNFRGNSLTYRMIIDSNMLLRKHRFRYRRIFQNSDIITEYIGWAINWHAKHSKLVSHRDKDIFRGTERNKFTSKPGRHNSILLFQKPYTYS